VPLGSYRWLTWAQANRPAWKQLDRWAAEQKEEERQQTQEQEFQQRFIDPASDWSVSRFGREAEAAFELAQPLLGQHPQRRDAKQTRRAINALVTQVPRLLALGKQLKSAGPYTDEEEDARQAALAWAEAQAALFREVEGRLRRGQRWTHQDENREAKVRNLWQRWRALLE
jgi:hypothetical protein